MEAYERLERQLAKWCGRSQTVVCSSGTAALHLALESLSLPLGSEVIVPEFTMIACARAVTLAGLKPVFIDCDDTLLLDPTLLSGLVTLNTSAIMPAHIYGRQCNMQHISEFAELHGLAVIEDLAEAHGIPPHPNTDAACWSFYQNKIVAGEEGGAVAFLDPEASIKARRLRSLGFSEAHNFLHQPRGMNYRLANALAKPILESLGGIAVNQKLRSTIESVYDSYVPTDWQMPPRNVCWVYDIRLPNVDTVDVVQRLNRAGVAARLAFKPMSEQVEYLGEYKHLNAYRLSRRVIYLSVNPGMTDATVARNVQTLCGLPLHPLLPAVAPGRPVAPDPIRRVTAPPS